MGNCSNPFCQDRLKNSFIGDEDVKGIQGYGQKRMWDAESGTKRPFARKASKDMGSEEVQVEVIEDGPANGYETVDLKSVHGSQTPAKEGVTPDGEERLPHFAQDAQGCVEEDEVLEGLSTKECKIRWLRPDDYNYGYLQLISLKPLQ